MKIFKRETQSSTFSFPQVLNTCSEFEAPLLPGALDTLFNVLTHDKLHLNFLTRVHLWDIFILSFFFSCTMQAGRDHPAQRTLQK